MILKFPFFFYFFFGFGQFLSPTIIAMKKQCNEKNVTSTRCKITCTFRINRQKSLFLLPRGVKIKSKIDYRNSPTRGVIPVIEIIFLRGLFRPLRIETQNFFQLISIAKTCNVMGKFSKLRKNLYGPRYSMLKSKIYRNSPSLPYLFSKLYIYNFGS